MKIVTLSEYIDMTASHSVHYNLNAVKCFYRLFIQLHIHFADFFHLQSYKNTTTIKSARKPWVMATK